MATQSGRPKTVGRNGSPRKISVWISAAQYNKLKARAEHAGVTVSEILRQAAA